MSKTEIQSESSQGSALQDTAIFLEAITRDSRTREAAELRDELLRRQPQRTEDGQLGGSHEDTEKISVVKGVGSKKETGYTGGVTLKGYVAVTAPDGGTWSIVVKVAGKKVIDVDGVVKNQKINFKAETNFWSETTVSIDVIWSEKEDTTLNLYLNYSY